MFTYKKRKSWDNNKKSERIIQEKEEKKEMYMYIVYINKKKR